MVWRQQASVLLLLWLLLLLLFFPREVLNALGLGVNFLCDDGNKQRISSVWDGGSRSTDFRISDSSESTVAGHMSHVTCHMSTNYYCAAPWYRLIDVCQSSVNAAAGCCSCLFRQCCGGCFLLAPHGHLTDNG